MVGKLDPRDGPITDDDVIDLMEGERIHTRSSRSAESPRSPGRRTARELCYTTKRVEAPEASTDSDLYIVPVDGGETQCITDGMDGFDRVPLYSPDGGRTSRSTAWCAPASRRTANA